MLVHHDHSFPLSFRRETKTVITTELTAPKLQTDKGAVVRRHAKNWRDIFILRVSHVNQV